MKYNGHNVVKNCHLLTVLASIHVRMSVWIWQFSLGMGSAGAVQRVSESGRKGRVVY